MCHSFIILGQVKLPRFIMPNLVNYVRADSINISIDEISSTHSRNPLNGNLSTTSRFEKGETTFCS